MATLTTVLTSLAGPLAKKVLTSLGIGVLTYAGLDTAASAALGAAKSNLGGMTADITQIIAMAGGFAALSIIAGGITAGVSMMVMSRLAKIT